MAGVTERFSDWVQYWGEFLTIKLTGKDPPHGWRGRALRFPVYLYDWGLGGLLGGRILVLGTVGRKTGNRRETPLEFLHDEATDTFFLMAGWGGRTDWFRNLVAQPRVRVRVGRRRFQADARVLGVEEGAEVLRSWVERTPRLAPLLERDSGVHYDGTLACAHEIAGLYGIAALQPLS